MASTGYDAAEVAVEAAERGEDILASTVTQALGAASACWEDLEGAGRFEDAACAEVAESLVDWLRPQVEARVRVETVDRAAGDRLVLVLEDDLSSEEMREMRDRLRAVVDGSAEQTVALVSGSMLAALLVVKGRGVQPPQLEGP